jgi:hypothetical protein
MWVFGSVAYLIPARLLEFPPHIHNGMRYVMAADLY